MSAFNNIVAALQDVGVNMTGSGDAARAQCPVHRSRGLTLSVRRKGDRTVIKCFAGCEDIDILAALGMTVRDLFDEPRDTSRPHYSAPHRPDLTPWENALAELGLRNAPPIEHVLNRMVVEAEKEGRR